MPPSEATSLAEANLRIAVVEAEALALRYEFEHRFRNSISIIRSIARRSIVDAESIEEYQSLLDGRLASYLRIQAATLMNPAAGLDLELLLADELLAVSIRTDGPVTIGGPDIRLNVHAAGVVGLVFHELATAAALGGACSRANGRLVVRWLIGGDDPATITILWSERGGRSVRLPEEGFASEMLRNVMAYEFAGLTEINHFDTGVDYRFHLSRELATLPLL